MDAKSENLFRDGSDVKNSKPSSEIKVGQKGKKITLKEGIIIKWDKIIECIDV